MTKKRVALALQGGGSHGAFTWGVVDRLIEDGRIEIEGISGTSAGAMNAVAIAQGFMKGGSEGIRQELRRYWQSISHLGMGSPFHPSILDIIQGGHGMAHSPGYIFFKFLSTFFSAHQLNPTNINPFGDFLERFFDFDGLRNLKDLKVFLCATNVRTSKLKIFQNHELSHKAMLASACLPQLFHAVEIEGEHYWDGGYIGNPAIYPLIDHCETRDIIVVFLSPMTRPTVPTTTAEITSRLSEVTFTNTLVREMRAINFVTKLIDGDQVTKGHLKRLNMHIIENENLFQNLSESSHINTEWYFLEHLYQEGRKTADAWLKANFDSIGVRSSVDLEDRFG